jgi:aminoglycoside/choline kinase family phosphotransferase
VIGIFARLCYRDGKAKYLDDVPRFFTYLRGVCSRRHELAPLSALLDDIEARVVPA